MKKRTILFDFDGTIADTLPEAVRMYNEIAVRKGYGAVTPENLQKLRSEGVRAIFQNLGVPLWDLPGILNELREGLGNKISNLKPFIGVPEALRALHEAGHRLGIVTSNSTESVKKFLVQNQLDIVDYLSMSGVFDKARHLEEIMDEHGLGTEDVVYVGDEVRDIDAAREAGVRVLSVTWGLNAREALEAKKPDYLADTPAEMLEVLSTR